MYFSVDWSTHSVSFQLKSFITFALCCYILKTNRIMTTRICRTINLNNVTSTYILICNHNLLSQATTGKSKWQLWCFSKCVCERCVPKCRRTFAKSGYVLPDSSANARIPHKYLETGPATRHMSGKIRHMYVVDHSDWWTVLCSGLKDKFTLKYSTLRTFFFHIDSI